MRRSWLVTMGLAVGVGGAALVAAEGNARACGGCFAPPEDNSVVTDHRMVLSISPQQTTLYDQIRYTGSPSSFAWVLPINGVANVGLSAEVVFSTLDGLTSTQVIPPPLNCPAPPDDCFRNAPTAGASEGDSQDAGVSVLKEETVGPYETVQLHSTDPQALNTWLTSHGYNVPSDVQAIIDAYVADHYDFLALKLVPGASVQEMRPVRVTTPGASPVLPLRMVTAGTGPTVGITLWMIGEGRWEPDNFPTFHIETSDIVWDWTTGSSNYRDLRAQHTTALAGRGWEIESSLDFAKTSIVSPVTYSGGTYLDDGGVQPDYDPVKDDQGHITKTADEVRQEDLDTLFAGMQGPAARITRIRADLAHAALDADLVLKASGDQATLSNQRQVTREANEPQCPVYDGCDQVGTAPRGDATAQTDANNANNVGGGGCNTSGRPLFDPTTLASLAGLAGVIAVRVRRRHRRNG